MRLPPAVPPRPRLAAHSASDPSLVASRWYRGRARRWSARATWTESACRQTAAVPAPEDAARRSLAVATAPSLVAIDSPTADPRVHSYQASWHIPRWLAHAVVAQSRDFEFP